jgi:hypothetical protein
MATEYPMYDMKLPNPWMQLLSSFGGNLAGGIGNILQGPTWQEMTSKRQAGRLEKEMNNPLVQEGQLRSLYPNIMNQFTPQLNELMAGLTKSGGLESGQGIGEATKYASENLMRLIAAIREKAMFANAQAPLQREQLLASITR